MNIRILSALLLTQQKITETVRVTEQNKTTTEDTNATGGDRQQQRWPPIIDDRLCDKQSMRILTLKILNPNKAKLEFKKRLCNSYACLCE